MLGGKERGQGGAGPQQAARRVLYLAAAAALALSLAIVTLSGRHFGSNPSLLAGAPTPTPKPARTCVINRGMANQVIVTIEKPAGANPAADAQLQQDAQKVQELCKQAAAGSQRFRQAIKNIGPFIIHVERTAGISFGVEGPPGGGVTSGRDAPGIGTSIDVGDHERTTLHGGDAANQAAVRAVALLYTLVHEIIGEELPGHDHTVINNEVITVMNQMGINVAQLGECKAATINGQRVQVFNWSVLKPSGPVVVQENITVANAGGGRLAGCSAGGPDTDGDGCSDAAESGPDETFGGRRDYLNPYDFYDIDGNKMIDLFLDIFSVAYAFGDDADSIGPGEPDGYDATLDRSAPLPGGDVWDMQGPDGMIDQLTDIFGVAFQFGHDCT